MSDMGMLCPIGNGNPMPSPLLYHSLKYITLNNMKKKTEKKLSLKMIRVAQLSANGADLVLGGGSAPTAPTGPITRPSGPSGPPTVPPDPCASGTCTVACPHGW